MAILGISPDVAVLHALTVACRSPREAALVLELTEAVLVERGITRATFDTIFNAVRLSECDVNDEAPFFSECTKHYLDAPRGINICPSVEILRGMLRYDIYVTTADMYALASICLQEKDPQGNGLLIEAMLELTLTLTLIVGAGLLIESMVELGLQPTRTTWARCAEAYHNSLVSPYPYPNSNSNPNWRPIHVMESLCPCSLYSRVSLRRAEKGSEVLSKNSNGTPPAKGTTMAYGIL